MTDLLFHCPACGAALIAQPRVRHVTIHPGLPIPTVSGATTGHLTLDVHTPPVVHDCQENP